MVYVFSSLNILYSKIAFRCTHFQDGTFIASAHDKLTYGSMVFVRVFIVNDCTNNMAKAVNIAVRYSAVRKQSKLRAKYETFLRSIQSHTFERFYKKRIIEIFSAFMIKIL